MSKNSKEKHLVVGREYIECDEPGCSRPGPPHRCSRCHRGFYCNVTCQRAHWNSGHKEECFELDLTRNEVLNIGSTCEGEVSISGGEAFYDAKQGGDDNDSPDAIVIKSPSNTCCFICLSEPMVDPFTLPRCGHTFCFGCLQTWQGHEHSHSTNRTSGQPTCPACRAAAPDIIKSIQESALLNAARASNSDLSEDEQRKYSELALDELDKIGPKAGIHPAQKIQSLFTRAEILQQLERPAEQLEALEEAEALNEEGTKNYIEMKRLMAAYRDASNEDRLDDADAIVLELEQNEERGSNIVRFGGSDLIDLYLGMAECKEAMGDYKGAMDVHKFKVMKEMEFDSAPPQQRRMLMGISRCQYHMGNYERAIEMGESAIEMNRYFPQVHKYVALSQKASGNLEAAVRTMGRAVNYETPWDEANRKVVLEMYEEMKKSASAGI